MKGVALIIVIFAMMLFAILGWTLANLQSGDFEINLRNLDSERALGLAESGVQWALGQLSADSCFRTGGDCNSVDSDCIDGADWLSTPHSLSPGQYNICCRNPTASELSLGYNTVIEARGYVASQANYRAMRQVKLEVTLGSFTKVLQAKNLFDWSAMHSGSRINGDIQALYYERNGNGIYNEPGIDRAGPPSPLPPDGGGDERTIAAEPYPTINMAYFESEAGTSAYPPAGPNTWAPPLTAKITTVSTVDAGTRTQLDLDTVIFTGASNWNAQALRNITMGAWQSGSWKKIYSVIDSDTVKLDGLVSWQPGERITLAPRIFSISTNIPNRTYTMTFDCALAWSVNEAVRNFSRNSWNYDYTDWGVILSSSIIGSTTTLTVRVDDSVDLNNSANLWVVNDWLGEAKRYRIDTNDQSLWYIMADVLFDLRNRQSWEAASINGNIRFKKTGLVTEGDITIKGTNRLQITKSSANYPNLASQNGNLISPDIPDGGSEAAKRGQRDFDYIVYTQNGSLFFNYLNAIAAYGNNVTFDGQVSLDYDNDVTSLTGFTWGLSKRIWREQ